MYKPGRLNHRVPQAAAELKTYRTLGNVGASGLAASFNLTRDIATKLIEIERQRRARAGLPL